MGAAEPMLRDTVGVPKGPRGSLVASLRVAKRCVALLCVALHRFALLCLALTALVYLALPGIIYLLSVYFLQKLLECWIDVILEMLELAPLQLQHRT